jgi:hypothetical protein
VAGLSAADAGVRTLVVDVLAGPVVADVPPVALLLLHLPALCSLAPAHAGSLLAQLGFGGCFNAQWQRLAEGHAVGEPTPVFPRLE